MAKVGELSELNPNAPLRVTVGSDKILIFLVEGKPVAIAARCPHANGPLHQGELCGTVLTCPWHGWSFDLVTGECDEDAGLRLPRYTVYVEGNDIHVTNVLA